MKTILDLDNKYNGHYYNRITDEDEVDLLTFNEYIANAKMAKEQKHTISHQSHRSLSKNKLVNFIRPLSNKETPMAKNKLEMQAEFNIQNLLKCKLKRKKVQQEIWEEKYSTKKLKNFNFKTPPPELAHIMPFPRRS